MIPLWLDLCSRCGHLTAVHRHYTHGTYCSRGGCRCRSLPRYQRALIWLFTKKSEVELWLRLTRW